VKSEMSHRLSTLSSVTFTLDAVSVGGWLPIAVLWSTENDDDSTISVVDTDAAAGDGCDRRDALLHGTRYYHVVDERAVGVAERSGESVSRRAEVPFGRVRCVGEHGDGAFGRGLHRLSPGQTLSCATPLCHFRYPAPEPSAVRARGNPP